MHSIRVDQPNGGMLSRAASKKKTSIWFSGPPSQYGGQMPARIGASCERTALQQKAARSLYSSCCPHTKWKHREALQCCAKPFGKGSETGRPEHQAFGCPRRQPC
ncbi:uncharacterized protein LOC119405989 [Rhipicephalus sanguineus]|uniref:uncharacterized protein LOC119405989 n=1 Tax=Rhipicephalus sanguineus TaxID=34632 RepID=UPI001893EDCF|nr:uncharacterized protein LOC119405989 [Rhipicephalus sanguineus]